MKPTTSSTSARRRNRSFSNSARGSSLQRRVAVAELRAAQRVVGEHAAVEAQLPAPLAARHRDARAVDELVAAQPGAELGAHVALVHQRQARVALALLLHHHAIAERHLDHVVADRQAAAVLLDAEQEPGEELAAEEALRLDDAEEVLLHQGTPVSPAVAPAAAAAARGRSRSCSPALSSTRAKRLGSTARITSTTRTGEADALGGEVGDHRDRARRRRSRGTATGRPRAARATCR